MDLRRVLKHMFATRAVTRRRFSRSVTEAIEQAVAAIERRTSGEIRDAIDTSLELAETWADKSPRDAACANATPRAL